MALALLRRPVLYSLCRLARPHRLNHLFKPQIEAWLERPYDHLALTGPPQAPSAQVKAALAAVPGTVLRAYELPQTPNSAARVIVSQGAKQVRVFVRPDNLQVLKVLNEDDRFMRTMSRLHGELLMGTGVQTWSNWPLAGPLSW